MTDYEISVPVRRPWIALALAFLLYQFRPFFLVTLLMARGIFRPQSTAEFFSCLILGVPFLAASLFCLSAMLRLILLNLIGEETLRLESGRLLKIRTSLLGMGKWKSFLADSLSGLRTGGLELEAELSQKSGDLKLEEMMRTRRLFAWTGRVLEVLGLRPALIFRAGGQTHWFGFGMEESAAREALARLRMHLPESAFQNGGEQS